MIAPTEVKPNLEARREAFMGAIDPNEHFQRLFDFVAGVSFFAKNRDGELMAANATFVRRAGFRTEAEVLGKRDFQLFPEALAENFRADDEEVMVSGEAKLGIVELFPSVEGVPDWYVTNKLPLRNRVGEVIGVMGTVQLHEFRRRLGERYGEMGKVVDYIRENLSDPLTIKSLASSIGLSARQFDRRFKAVFGITPKSFIIKTRIQEACGELQDGVKSISDVAHDLGFYDQSSFTMHFRRQMGVTPLKYQQHYRQGGGDVTDFS